MLTEDPTLITHDFTKKIKKIVDSDLYKCFLRLPKTGVHHIHLTGACDINFLIYLTYFDSVYYSHKDNMFHVSAKGCDKEGYMKVNTLR